PGRVLVFSLGQDAFRIDSSVVRARRDCDGLVRAPGRVDSGQMDTCAETDGKPRSAAADSHRDNVESWFARRGIHIPVHALRVLRCLAESRAARILRRDGLRELL